MDVHTICLISETMLYCVLAFYQLWNIFLFSFSSCLSRSCGSYPLRGPNRSDCTGILPWNHNNWYQSIQIVSQQWYAFWRSILEKMSDPTIVSNRSSSLGMRNIYLIVIILMALLSTHILQLSSFLSVSNTGVAQGLRLSRKKSFHSTHQPSS